MNYPGLENLRADVAALSNAMCDVRMLLNRLESQHRHDAATLKGLSLFRRLGMVEAVAKCSPHVIHADGGNGFHTRVNLGSTDNKTSAAADT